MLVQAIRYRLPASRPFGFGYLTECLRQTPSDDSLANRNSAGRSFCSTILLSFSGRSYVAFREGFFLLIRMRIEHYLSVSVFVEIFAK